ncbi:Signal transduction histidine-protein kinase/phosphatase DegS [Corynebacterium kalinowskii]|uniref:histidine kinase n=1 Tax=Corynebacterium kalinowskii TaxID=2675216 RepID=A0A6B8W873_9CORY|nr:histidine kinase [Corynebacterium kalinowskii]QGU03258.1 Signal transduction histidine-protein kinase/phosphatase DegS [Corynebacterium kalinowskii]
MWFGRRKAAGGEAEAVARIAELTASRRAVADAYEIERRRIERDLHDGAQQYLVAALMKLGEASLDATGSVADLIEAAQADVAQGLESLRATVHGIHPQVLSDRGLVAAVSAHPTAPAVVAPYPLPELSPSVLAAGYFFASEALTNAAKYAPNAQVSVLLTADADLRISVVDDGPGGAVIRPNGGLAGMRERLEAFDGSLTLSSPVGGPTRVVATIPLLLDRGEPGVAS